MAQKTRSTDLVLIVSAVLIAYFIWLIAKLGNVEEETLDGVPITVEVPSYLEVDLARKTASVQVRFPKSLRREIHSGAFHVLISTPELFTQAGVRTPQAVTVPLLAEDVRCPSLPQSVQVQKIDPGRLTMQVKFRTATARIVPRFDPDTPAPGYHLEKSMVSQNERLVTGSKERLDALRNKDGIVLLPTSPIPLTNRRDSFSTSVAILLPEEVSLVDEEARRRLPRDVSLAVIQVIIKEEEVTRTLTGRPIQVPLEMTRELMARTRPATGTVTIAGPRSLVESLDPRAIYLRPKTLPEERVGVVSKVGLEARLEESAPADIRIVSVQPETIELSYETRPTETKTTPTLTPTP